MIPDKTSKSINAELLESYDQLNETEDVLRMEMDGFWGIRQDTWNIIFALINIIGQVAQNVILPIWFVSIPNAAEGNSVDPLWICISYAIFYIIFFGICVIIFDVIKNKTISNMTQLKRILSLQYIKQYIILGVTSSVSGLLIIFASRKCAPFLQTILGLFIIFWVILFRYFILHKSPTNKQFIYAIFVFLGLFLASIPSIFGLGSKDAFKTKGNQVWQILWPLLYAISAAPDAIYSVATESVLKDTYYEKQDDDIADFSTLSIWWVSFMMSLFQFIVWIPVFWIDAVPTFGAANNISQIFDHIKTDYAYMFGLESNINARCIYLPWIFNIIAIITTIAFYYMMRYTEGATWGALINCIVSPLGAMFWFLFELKDDGWFGWQPSWKFYDLYAVAGLILMTPFVYLYHVEASKRDKHK